MGSLPAAKQPLERPLEPPLGVSAQALDVARFPFFQEEFQERHVASCESEPEEGELLYLLRGGISFRPVVQALAFGRHAVAGGLAGERLCLEGQAGKPRPV